MSENSKQAISIHRLEYTLIILKEFYRLAILAVSIFFGYFLLAHSNVFKIENSIKELSLKILYVLATILVATIITKSLNLFFWEKYQQRKNIHKVPALLKQGINFLIYSSTLLFVLNRVFAVPIGGMLTASGAFGVVVGLALKELISDIFAGMIMSLDKTIKIGDFVRIEIRPYAEKVGMVTDMNWRTVHLTTPENLRVIVPNSQLTANLLTNLSEPSPHKEFELVFTFDFDVPSERVLRVLTSALLQTGEIMQDPEFAPKARISKISGTGVDYKVKYWIVPSRIGPGKAKHYVMNNILFNLNQSGLSMCYPKNDIFTAPMPQRNLDIRTDRLGLLKKIELFSVLSSEETRDLAVSMVERTIAKDQYVVKQGETGSSMFIIVEGLLSVFIPDPNTSTEVKVATIRPGDYFGELSMLTGEPRSASIKAFSESIIFELSKDHIDGILKNNPDLALMLSQKIAETKIENENLLLNRNEKEKEATTSELSKNILGKILDFFKL